MKQPWIVFLVIMMLAIGGCSNGNKDVNQQDDSHPSASPKADHQQDKTDSQTKTTSGTDENKSDKTEDQTKTVSDPKDQKDQKDQKQQKDQTSSEETSNNKDKTVAEEDTVKVASDENKSQGLIAFRPKSGIKKTFVQNQKYEVTYDITAENQKYVQRVIHLGASAILQILEWGKDQVSIVYQKQNPQDTSNQMDSFKANKPPETLIDLNQSDKGADWQVIGTGKTVEVPYGKFENVSVVQQTEKAENGVKKTDTAYYAPGMGLIKEVDDVSGDSGYHSVTVLKKVTPLNP